MPVMIWIAIIIEAGILNWIDFGILLFIQFANASIGFYEITKAGDAVEQLKKSLKSKASVCREQRTEHRTELSEPPPARAELRTE